MHKWIVLLVVMSITTIGTSQDSLDWVITAKYEYTYPIHEGMAVIQTKSLGYIVINTKEDTLFIMSDDKYIDYFSEGMAIVEHNSTFQFVDRKGKVVIPQRFDRAYQFKDGIAAVERDGAYGFINKQGAVVIPFKYHSAGIFSDERCRVGKTNVDAEIEEFKELPKLYGFIDKSGKQVVDFIYDKANAFSDGLALVYKKDKIGYIDINGKVVIPFQFQTANNFSEGLASVSGITEKQDIITEEEDKKYNSINEPQKTVNLNYGFIDKKGKLVIPCQFRKVEDFSNGLAAAQDSVRKWGFINKVGNWVVKPQYKNVRSFSEGLAAVKINAFWGFIDTSGNIIIPLVLKDVLASSEGLIAAADYLSGKWGYLRNPLYKRKE